MTDLQREVWATVYALHFDRLTQSMDPRIDGDAKEAYLERASTLAAVRAYEAARHAPGEA